MKKTIMNLSKLSLVVILSISLGCTTTTSTATRASTDEPAEINTIDELPKATSPVEASSSSSVSSLAFGELLELGAATTGLPLGATTATSFDSTSSLASCEMFNMTKEAINSAAMGDLILCYIQNTFAAAADTVTDTDGNLINIYDGNFHTFTLDFTGASLCGDNENEPCTGGDDEDNGPDKIKFKITRDPITNRISNFTMFACADNSQEMYITQTIDTATFAMNTINSGSNTEGSDTFTFASDTTVSGTINSDGRFSDSKNILMNVSNTSSNFDFWGVLDYTQQPTLGSLNGYMSGSSAFGSNTFTFNDRIVGSVQLIDANTDLSAANYNIGSLAMGDGCVKFCVEGGGSDFESDADCTENQANDSNTWRDLGVECWNGDTSLTPALSDPTTSDFHANVNDATFPTATQPTITFTGDAVWDCSDTPEATMNFAALGVSFDSCQRLSLGHQRIDCWHIAGDGASSEESEQDSFSGCSVAGTDSVSAGNITAMCNCSNLSSQLATPCANEGNILSSICTSSSTMSDCLTAIQAQGGG